MQSFDEFARAELPGLLRFAAVLTGSRQLGEDVVQEAMIRAHDRWTHIGGLDVPEAYVRRMVVNQYLSWRRKWARIVPSAELEDERHAPDPAVGVADRDDLARRLKLLPHKQRAVIVLRYYQGLSDPEIAELLGCRSGTVRSHASRALAALRLNTSETTHLAVLRRES